MNSHFFEVIVDIGSYRVDRPSEFIDFALKFLVLGLRALMLQFECRQFIRTLFDILFNLLFLSLQIHQLPFIPVNPRSEFLESIIRLLESFLLKRKLTLKIRDLSRERISLSGVFFR